MAGIWMVMQPILAVVSAYYTCIWTYRLLMYGAIHKG